MKKIFIHTGLREKSGFCHQELLLKPNIINKSRDMTKQRGKIDTFIQMFPCFLPSGVLHTMYSLPVVVSFLVMFSQKA